MGVRSVFPGAFGGFHHPEQGYRHFQMGAIVTRYGDLADPSAVPAALVALDLLRAYVHDCLHYGAFREYRMWGGRVVRTAYGINRRDQYGRSYSAPDPSGSASTRNLGVVMEGAGDREARSIARAAAANCGVPEPEHPVDRLAYRDAIGGLDDGDHARLADPRFLSGFQETGAGGAARRHGRV